MFLSLLSLSCLFPLISEGPAEHLTFSIAGSVNDTISPFGPLKIRFSAPIKHPDSVGFNFTPPFTEYQTVWSNSLDTATLIFSLSLNGNAGYRVLVTGRTDAANGALLIPGDDTINLRTWRCEQEPNGSPSLADPLHGRVFGRVNMANDTDWFAPADTMRREFYLKSTGSLSIFSIRDSRGTVLAHPTYAPAETLSVPADFVPPLYVLVYAYERSNGGSYESGWTAGQKESDPVVK